MEHFRFRRSQRGQTSTAILMAVAGLVILSMATFNVGLVNMTKTETANAADAAALAAASWVSSAENEVALGPARTMWIFHIVFQIMCAFPFLDWQSMAMVWFIYEALQASRSSVANWLLREGWFRAHMTAHMTAVRNLNIDAPEEAFEAWTQEMEDAFERLHEQVQAGQDDIDYPTTFGELTWDRRPDAEGGEQSVQIEVEFSEAQPKFTTSHWGPLMWGVFDCSPPSPCWTPVGWRIFNLGEKLEKIKWAKNLLPSYAPRISSKLGLVPIFLMLPMPHGKPKEIENRDGKITVRVTRTSEERDLRLLEMQYPEKIVSIATAEYKDGRPEQDGKHMIEYSPRDTSLPQLVEVDEGL